MALLEHAAKQGGFSQCRQITGRQNDFVSSSLMIRRRGNDTSFSFACLTEQADSHSLQPLQRIGSKFKILFSMEDIPCLTGFLT
jgi:hypothetical protein